MHNRPAFILIITILAAAAFLLLFPNSRASADIGPKPSMNFTFVFQGEAIPILEPKLLLCADQACSSYEVYKGSFDCSDTGCFTFSPTPLKLYSFAEYHKLVITFQDKTRESNVFTKRNFGAAYRVAVGNDNLDVRERFGLFSINPLYFLCSIGALALTLPVEVGVAAIFTRILNIKKRFLLWVVLANILSIPIIWFIIGFFPTVSTTVFFILAEGYAIGFEAAFLFLFGRRYGITFKLSSILSIVMNLASVLVGAALWFMFLVAPTL